MASLILLFIQKTQLSGLFDAQMGSQIPYLIPIVKKCRSHPAELRTDETRLSTISANFVEAHPYSYFPPRPRRRGCRDTSKDRLQVRGWLARYFVNSFPESGLTSWMYLVAGCTSAGHIFIPWYLGSNRLAARITSLSASSDRFATSC